MVFSLPLSDAFTSTMMDGALCSPVLSSPLSSFLFLSYSGFLSYLSLPFSLSISFIQLFIQLSHSPGTFSPSLCLASQSFFLFVCDFFSFYFSPLSSVIQFKIPFSRSFYHVLILSHSTPSLLFSLTRLLSYFSIFLIFSLSAVP